MITAPTLTDLFNGISAEFKTNFGISSSNDLKRVLTAFAASEAGFLKLLYFQLLDVQKNCYPDLADSTDNGGTLERFGQIRLNRLPTKATQGEYIISISGTSGTVLPLGTQFKTNSTTNKIPAIYTTTENVTLVNGIATVHVLSNKFGTDYELSTNDLLYTVNPIININPLAIVSNIVIPPTNDEDIEVYRALILQSFRLEPTGGSPSDYVLWALDVPGIRTVYPLTTPGTACSGSIYVESNTNNGVATQAQLDALWKVNYVNGIWSPTGVFELNPDETVENRGRRQLGFSNLIVESCQTLSYSIEIKNLTDQSDAVKSSILSSLKSIFYKKRPYRAGVDDPNHPNDTLRLSDVIFAVENALVDGNSFDDVIVSAPTEYPLPMRFFGGLIPIVGNVTYSN